MSVMSDLVDAVADDLDANAGLPDHDTIRYRRPRAIMPDDCPLLVVWFASKDVSLEAGTTDRFDKAYSIGVSYHVETVAEAQSLVNDPEMSKELMTVLEAIEARSHYLSTNGVGVSPVYQVLPGSSVYMAPEMKDALVEGVVHEIVARASEV